MVGRTTSGRFWLAEGIRDFNGCSVCRRKVGSWSKVDTMDVAGSLTIRFRNAIQLAKGVAGLEVAVIKIGRFCESLRFGSESSIGSCSGVCDFKLLESSL